MGFGRKALYDNVHVCSLSKCFVVAAALAISSLASAQVGTSDAVTTAGGHAWGRSDSGTTGTARGAENMMSRMDKNSDGKITREELGRDKLFDRLDANKDGSVTKDELQNMPQHEGKGKDGGKGKGKGKKGPDADASE